ncbi:hypothetical protein [Streptomyces sp. NPDC046759]|uniref:hypothetical protein n=1 Tax=Streptomyces sp. NPDC046759 TaxID=3155019 RepID=UPI0033D599CB
MVGAPFACRRPVASCSPRLVGVPAGCPEAAAEVLAELAAPVRAHADRYDGVNVLGPAAGAVSTEALRVSATGVAGSAGSPSAAPAYHRVTGDPGPALAFVGRQLTGAASERCANAVNSPPVPGRCCR